MKRREFLIRAGQTILAAPMVLTAISCGDEGSPTDTNMSNGFSVSSSPDQTGHAHATTFACADLSSGKLTYTSLAASGHVHTLTLTMDQLNQINAGQSVGPITSDTVFGHNHAWTVQKPSNACA